MADKEVFDVSDDLQWDEELYIHHNPYRCTTCSHLEIFHNNENISCSIDACPCEGYTWSDEDWNAYLLAHPKATTLLNR